jgi:hypothetical protein
MTIADYLQKLRDPKEAIKTVIVATFVASMSIIGTQGTTYLWNVALNRLEFQMVRAEIERTRQDVRHVSCASAAMVLSKAMDYNIRIWHEQEALRHRYSRWAVTSHWNEVAPIEFPCRPEE